MVNSGIRSADIRNQENLFFPATCFLMSIYLIPVLLISASLFPAITCNFGVHGTLYPIEEEDPIQLIHQKLKTLEESGQLAQRNQEMAVKTLSSIKRPHPVEGITRALKTRVFTFDPTYVVSHDLTDHQGHIFARHGDRINPLEKISLSQPLLFFDGDDEEQRTFAQEQLKKGPLRLILVKGEPLNLSESWRVPIYFDQGGHLTQKLGICRVPALVTQSSSSFPPDSVTSKKKAVLRIEERSLE